VAAQRVVAHLADGAAAAVDFVAFAAGRSALDYAVVQAERSVPDTVAAHDDCAADSAAVQAEHSVPDTVAKQAGFAADIAVQRSVLDKSAAVQGEHSAPDKSVGHFEPDTQGRRSVLDKSARRTVSVRPVSVSLADIFLRLNQNRAIVL
jgi:hypothetical protein